MPARLTSAVRTDRASATNQKSAMCRCSESQRGEGTWVIERFVACFWTGLLVGGLANGEKEEPPGMGGGASDGDEGR
jgi:hypothetical protein